MRNRLIERARPALESYDAVHPFNGVSAKFRDAFVAAITSLHDGQDGQKTQKVKQYLRDQATRKGDNIAAFDDAAPAGETTPSIMLLDEFYGRILNRIETERGAAFINDAEMIADESVAVSHINAAIQEELDSDLEIIKEQLNLAIRNDADMQREFYQFLFINSIYEKYQAEKNGEDASPYEEFEDEGKTIPSTQLTKKFCSRVLQKMKAKNKVIADNQQANADIRNAIFRELARARKFKNIYDTQRIKHDTKDKTAETKTWTFVFENYILDKTPDALDNTVTAGSRILKHVHINDLVNNIANTATNAYNGIMYGFFGIMVLGALKFPISLLYYWVKYRDTDEWKKATRAEKNAMLGINSQAFAFAGIYVAIAVCTGLAVLPTAIAVAMGGYFVIGLFSLALLAHSVALCFNLHTKAKYKESIAKIATLRTKIQNSKARRHDLYVNLPNHKQDENRVRISDINEFTDEINKDTADLKETLAAHRDIKLSYDKSYSKVSMGFNITCIVLAACTVAAFALTVFFPPAFMAAVTAMTVLGMVVLGVYIAKQIYNHHLLVKSKKASTSSVDISTPEEKYAELGTTNKLNTALAKQQRDVEKQPLLEEVRTDHDVASKNDHQNISYLSKVRRDKWLDRASLKEKTYASSIPHTEGLIGVVAKRELKR